MSNIGEIVVPNPNITAIPILSNGVANGKEYASRAIKGGHKISPLVKPSEKAPKSIPYLLNLLDDTVLLL
jgi:hypothetical protein